MDIREEHKRLNDLLDLSPEKAIEQARKLPNDHPNWIQLQAAIFCDAGQIVERGGVARELGQEDPRPLDHGSHVAAPYASRV